MRTSNFEKSGADPKAVAICRGLPEGWMGRWYPAVAPTWEMINGINEPGGYEAFEKGYIKILEGLDPKRVWEDLGPDAVLLCYSPPNVKCHRRLLAEWLEKALGVEITEVGLRRDEVLSFAEAPTKQERDRKLKEQSQ
ncbi:MAG: hypothetical protein ACM3ZU_11410 [Bacteroidota bacterium]